MKRVWASLMAIGALPGETHIRRGARRIVVGYLFLGALVRFAFAAGQLAAGSPEGWVDLTAATMSVILLIMLGIRASWFIGIVNTALLLLLVENLVATVIDGGLVPSDIVILFGLLGVVGALIVLSIRAAFGWLLAYSVTVVLAVVLPSLIDPLHEVTGSDDGIAVNILGVTIFLFAGMAYFVRQRNRFQGRVR